MVGLVGLQPDTNSSGGEWDVEAVVVPEGFCLDGVVEYVKVLGNRQGDELL